MKKKHFRKFYREERKISKRAGKTDEHPISIRQADDLLTLSPIDYAYSTRFAAFEEGLDAAVRQLLSLVNADEYNTDVFDSLIDAEVAAMRHFAATQFAGHTETLLKLHHKILEETVLLEQEAEDYNAYIDELEQQLAVLRRK